MEEINCNRCKSHVIHFVKYKMKNGIDILRKQCLDCGYLNSLNYKRSFVKDFDSLPYHDKVLREKQRDIAIKKSYIKSVLFYYSQKHFERQKNYYRNVYLNSKEWKEKRELIMSFYNWICQKCGEKATDLHHVTYDNIFKEKFEDLQPLCRYCHENEHQENNIENKIKGLSLASIKERKIEGLSLASIKEKKNNY